MRPYAVVLLIALSIAAAAWLWTAKLGTETRCLDFGSPTSGTPGFCLSRGEIDVRAEWQPPVAAFVAMAALGLGAVLLLPSLRPPGYEETRAK